MSYRSYGEFIENGPQPGSPGHARVKGLEGHFDPLFRSFDLKYSDQRRADRFLAELKRFESEGEMPGLIILRLPNDHTAGTKRGAPTPTAYLADNDLALGRVVEAVSHGKFWKDTAIFVLEDDAQNGPDHVDAHRSPALVVSPYTKRRHVDSSMYSTSSMLRTMELILGLKPMTQFDAAAQPMYGFVPGRGRPDALYAPAGQREPGRAQRRPGLGRGRFGQDGFPRGRRGRRAAVERNHLAFGPRRRPSHAAAGPRGVLCAA